MVGGCGRSAGPRGAPHFISHSPWPRRTALSTRPPRAPSTSLCHKPACLTQASPKVIEASPRCQALPNPSVQRTRSKQREANPARCLDDHTHHEETHMEEMVTRRMNACAVCGKLFDQEPILALISVQSTSGVGVALAAHRECVLNVLNPDARATLDDGPSPADPPFPA